MTRKIDMTIEAESFDVSEDLFSVFWYEGNEYDFRYVLCTTDKDNSDKIGPYTPGRDIKIYYSFQDNSNPADVAEIKAFALRHQKVLVQRLENSEKYKDRVNCQPTSTFSQRLFTSPRLSKHYNRQGNYEILAGLVLLGICALPYIYFGFVAGLMFALAAGALLTIGAYHKGYTNNEINDSSCFNFTS